MPYQRKVSDEDLLSSYSEDASVWHVAARFGMCGQSVHERLVKLGAINHLPVFTAAERDRMLAEYEDHARSGRLGVLAASMGRTKTSICRVARLLGLTDSARKRPYNSEHSSKMMLAWHASNEHPRGMLGKSHSSQSAASMSASQKMRWSSLTDDERASLTLNMMKGRAAKYGPLAGMTVRGTWKAGWRDIGGKKAFYRSRWEANYARYLQYRCSATEIAAWDHEPKVFWFEESVCGSVRSYRPDFMVTSVDNSIAYHEVKGWWDERSRMTIASMERFYPSVALTIIGKAAYLALDERFRTVLPGWE